MKVDFKVLETKLVPIEKVVANDYNPNKLAKPELELLKKSIIDNGFCMPIITIYDSEKDKYVIVDGFHRYSVSLDLKLDQVPVVVLKHDIKKRMAATIQFNRARGTHQILDMSKIVSELTKKGWSDTEISKHLGMEADELIRLKQISGLKENFKNHVFSKTWEEFERKLKNGNEKRRKT